MYFYLSHEFKFNIDIISFLVGHILLRLPGPGDMNAFA